MLFNNYPEIVYKIGSRNITLRDIFKNVAFINIENNDSYYDYYIQDGETPETVSTKFYGTPAYSWLILMVNNIADIKNEWFVSQQQYEKINEANYGGNAFYISALPDLQPGDVLVKVTATQGTQATGVTANIYANIADFDKNFRKIRGISGSGSFNSGDYILFARKQESGSVIPIKFLNNQDPPEETNYTQIIFVEPYGNSVNYFYNSNNVILNPYKYGLTGITGVQTNTIYSNPGDTLTVNNFARTILYRYGACGGVSENGILKQELNTENFSNYIERQKIKILRQDLLPSVISSLKSALENNLIGKQFKVDL